LAGFALVAASMAASGAGSEPTVRVNGELLVGTSLASDPRGAVFKGIPFAAPPLGQLRWEAPRPRIARHGPQQAKEFAPGCFQDDYNAAWYGRVMRAFGATGTFRNPPFSEDCLYLNVWTPELSRRARLPVMVWIHGGANLSGWSFEPNYQAENLAVRGHVLVVSIAYRLGVFGFLSHPQLGAPELANAGLLDQIASLRWVRDNIEVFGGDPAQVTVFGESAGAADIGYLMSAPAAAGLFRRAISQSGGYFLRENVALDAARAAGARLAAHLGAGADLKVLRACSSAEILAAAKQALKGYHYGPVIDGVLIRRAPADEFRVRGAPVDLLIGSNEDEWYMYVDAKPESLAAALQAIPQDAREPLRERGAREPDARRAHARITSLADMQCPPYLLAAAAARNGKRAWVYRFTRMRPGAGGEALRAYHGAEIPYVFDSHDAWFSADEAEPRLTEAMLAYWSNFARSGDPNRPGLPAWPAFGATGGQVQELGTRIAPMEAPDAGLCARLEAALYPTPNPSTSAP
jgi:para-nitrobenzyl esterase